MEWVDRLQYEIKQRFERAAVDELHHDPELILLNSID
jgi:hypothetical protein